MTVMLSRHLTRATVSDAMVRRPKVLADSSTIADVRAFFLDEHVHAALIVRAGSLLSVIERRDLDPHLPDGMPALTVGRLGDRVVHEHTQLPAAEHQLRTAGGRRLAVIDADGALKGLLCLKGSGCGYCSDNDVEARAADPH